MRNTPDYQIELSGGGKVPLLFNSWTFRTFTRGKGIEFEDLMENVYSGKAFRSNDLPELLLAAAKSYARFNDVDVNYSEDDSFEWLDELGGMNSLKLMDIYKVFAAKLLNVSPEKFEVLWTKATEITNEQAEKKKADSPGETLTSSQPAQA
jgi:hypothetical protein